MVFIAEKRDVVALFGEIAFVADIGRQTPSADGQTGLPAPGHLFKTGRIAVEIGEFRSAAEEIVAYRTTVEAERAGRDAQEQRHVEILVFLVFDDFANAGFSDDVVYFIGIEDEFGLEEELVADAGIQTELCSELDFVDAKVESSIAAANDDVFWFDGLGVQATFDAERKLCLGSMGGEKNADYKKQIFHTSRFLCADSVLLKTPGRRLIRMIGGRFNYVLTGVLKETLLLPPGAACVP